MKGREQSRPLPFGERTKSAQTSKSVRFLLLIVLAILSLLWYNKSVKNIGISRLCGILCAHLDPNLAAVAAQFGMVRDHEAVGSNPATRTTGSVLKGSEHPAKDTPHFYVSGRYRHFGELTCVRIETQDRALAGVK